MRALAVLLGLAATAALAAFGRSAGTGAVLATAALGITALVVPLARRPLAPFLVATAALAVVLVLAGV